MSAVRELQKLRSDVTAAVVRMSEIADEYGDKAAHGIDPKYTSGVAVGARHALSALYSATEGEFGAKFWSRKDAS